MLARDCEEIEHDDDVCGFDDDVPDVDDVSLTNVPIGENFYRINYCDTAQSVFDF